MRLLGGHSGLCLAHAFHTISKLFSFIFISFPYVLVLVDHVRSYLSFRSKPRKAGDGERAPFTSLPTLWSWIIWLMTKLSQHVTAFQNCWEEDRIKLFMRIRQVTCHYLEFVIISDSKMISSRFPHLLSVLWLIFNHFLTLKIV